jgi:hypothetical protein
MKARLTIFTVVTAAVLCTGAERASADDPVERFLAQLRGKVDSAEKEKRTALAGDDGWLFFVPELRSLSVGPFWGENAVKLSRSSKSEYADPLPAIVDFHQQLKKAGVGLLVVPVPAKVAVYPERLATGIDRPPTDSLRFDPYQRQFYDVLKDHGVNVLDLLPLFVEHRGDESAMYCRTDSHWSPAAVALAAEAIAVEAKRQGWWQSGDKPRYETQDQQLTLTGDLARMLNESQPERETLRLTSVGERKASGIEPLKPDRASPVLLMGDSHTLVFHDPELFARGAGLPDHLALRLATPVDLMGVRGSGATATRIELLRRRDNLQGKKLVIWCFSFREFTESFTGWRKVPVLR